MSRFRKFVTVGLLAASMAVGSAILFSGYVEAASTNNNSSDDSKSSGNADDFDRGQKAFENGDWKDAVKNLKNAVAKDSKNAEAYNLMGYSYRRLGEADSAFDAYAKALNIDPKHRGAHEYLGQTYLLIGDAAKAHSQLVILTELCGKQCKETVKLRKAIKRHEANANEQVSFLFDEENW